MWLSYPTINGVSSLLIGIFTIFALMKYFLIAGEASGDLHAGRLIKAIRKTTTTPRLHSSEATVWSMPRDAVP